MLRRIGDQVTSLFNDATPFSSREAGPSNPSRSKSKQWQDDTGLSSWANASRQANEQRQRAAKVMASDCEKRSINLENLNLTQLPPEENFAALKNVRSLSLAGNNLTNIVPAISLLPRLTHLNISGNLLGQIPVEIEMLPNLRTLDASHAGVEHVPSQIGNLRDLQNLNLSQNALDRLPREIGNLANLEVLKLSGNMLDARPTGLGLDESQAPQGSQTPGLPPEVGNLRKLRDLDLSSNHFQRVPAEIGQLGNLKKLKFNHNALADTANYYAIPNSVAHLKKLSVLDVSDNTGLTSLPRDFGPLQYISKTKLQLGRQQQNKSQPAKLLSRTLSSSRTKSEDQPPVGIEISVANTAIPWVMPAAGRLPALKSNERPPLLQPRALYVAPNYAGPREMPVPVAAEERAGTHPPPNILPPGMMAPPVMAQFDGMQQQPMAYGMQRGLFTMPQTAQHADHLQQNLPFMPFSARSAMPERVQSFDERSDCSTDSFSSAPDVFLSEPSPLHPSRSGPSGPVRDMEAPPVATNPAVSFQPFLAPSFGLPSHGAMGPTTSRPLAPAQPLPQAEPQHHVALQFPYPGGGPIGQMFNAQYPQQPQVPFSSALPFGRMPVAQNGFQLTGTGIASALHNPMFAGLLGKIAAGLHQNPAGVSQRGGGGHYLPSGNSAPQLVSPAQGMFERIGIASVQASRLKGLSESCCIKLEGNILNQRVLAAWRSASPGQTLWNLGLTIFRQNFINDLASSVAEANRDKKRNSLDPLDALLVDDPKQIALVYQTLVSTELGIPGFEDWRQKLDNGSEEYLGIFGRVVTPSNFNHLRMQLITTMFEEEGKMEGLAVAQFVENQNFWKQFQREMTQLEKSANQQRPGY